MPPAEGIAVTPADLINHAGHVETVAAGVASARQAGEATAPGPEAYGKLCVIVPILVGQLHGMVVEGIGAAEQSLHDTAGRLRTAAGGYQDADTRSATAVRRAGPPP